MICDSTYLMMIYFKNKYQNKIKQKTPSVSSNATTIDIQINSYTSR